MPLTSASTRRLAAQTLSLLRDFAREDGGQDLIEYAYLAAFIATAGYVFLNGIGPAVAVTYATWIDPNSGTPSLWTPGDPWTSAGS